MTRISQTDWVALTPLLNEMIDLPLDERTAWLARRRISHPALAAMLEEMVDREGRLDSDGILDHSLLAEAPRASSLVGQTLGGYQIDRELGAGGMGTVWLGHRADGRYQGLAAIKFLSLAVAGAAGEARFRREGSVLARLAHPNIARLLDAGLTAAGQPYLVLEYVEGRPVDEWCDQRRISVEQRLRLFLQVLEAVAYTHERFIVHRDLKPANILVTADGTIKLLDFGIAKLVEEGAQQPTALTGSNEAVLTFRYAAPEQILGEPVTAATDVYSLGVVLFELLTGQHPTNSTASTPAEHVRAIVDTEPGQLSRAVSASASVSKEVALQLAAARNASPELLRRHFAGDLDNIVAMALRKKPEARYPTVRAFADDLARHLGHEPVLARGDAWSYRAAKFLRRHRLAVGSATLILLTLIGAVLVTAQKAREAARQRDIALYEVHRERLMGSLQEVLAADVRGPDGTPLSPRQRIDLALDAVRHQHGHEPDLLAEAIADFSGTFYQAGDRPTMHLLLAEAQQVAREHDLPAQLAAASCSRAWSFVFDDQLDSAVINLAEAKSAVARLNDPVPDVTAGCLQSEAQLLVAQGQPDSGVRLLQQAIGMLQTGPMGRTRMDLTVIKQVGDLSIALKAARRTREASVVQMQMLRDLEAAGYLNTNNVPAASIYLQSALKELGEFAVAESAVAAVGRKQAASNGFGRPSSLVSFLTGYAYLLMERPDSAEYWLTLAGRDTSGGSEGLQSPGYLPTAMSRLRIDQGRATEARTWMKGMNQESRYRRLQYATNLARLQWIEGNRRGALTELEESIRKNSGSGDKPAVDAAYPMTLAAEWRLATGDVAAADSLARRARETAAIDRLALGRSAMVARAELVLARALAREGRGDDARAAAGRAIIAAHNGYGAGSPRELEARALVDSLAAAP